MKTNLLAVTICFLLAVAVICAGTLVETSLAEKRDKSATPARTNPQPDLGLINDLDRVIQLRFLTAPSFGMRRIGPNPNPHLDHFVPGTKEEGQAVVNLENAEWKVGVYLFGRRAYPEPPKKDSDAKEGLLVQYKLNAPVVVTTNLKKKELASPRRLREGVDEAFERFKEAESYDFSVGKWLYVARPVRGKESCLQCHRDFFVTSKLGHRKYAYRSRRAGDPIGVLVYAFGKKS